MSRFSSYGRLDTQDAADGDVPSPGRPAFVGINSTLDRDSLPPGMIHRGENTRIRQGSLMQRPGTAQPLDFVQIGGFTNFIVGSGVFRNPNGDEVLLIAPAGVTYVMAFQYGKDPVQIDYSATEIASGRTNGFDTVRFVQSFDKVSLLRFPAQSGQKNLIWDGVNTDKWEIISLSATGSTLVPVTWDGEPFMDRIIYYWRNDKTVPNRDTWIMSDIEDYTSYDNVFQNFRTNPGESDYITRIKTYFRGSVVIFKNQSIHQATLQPTFPVTITQRVLNSILGGFMPIMVGGDMIFASRPNGFYRLSQIIQDQTNTLPVPISEGIQATIDQIDWDLTEQYGCSEALGNRVFFGVALKGASNRLNAILVYDTERFQWESVPDTWMDSTFGFNALHVTNFAGVHRVFAVDYQESVIYLLYEGLYDDLKSGLFAVPFVAETRGYGDGVMVRRFIRLLANISTFNPLLTITAISDGFNEEKVLTPTPITKDRTKFYTYGHKTFDPATDDPREQKREDYSASLDTAVAIEDFEDLVAGEISFLPGTAVVTDLGDTQQTNERFPVRANGRWMSLRFENNDGYVAILGTAVESIPSVNNVRTAA